MGLGLLFLLVLSVLTTVHDPNPLRQHVCVDHKVQKICEINFSDTLLAWGRCLYAGCQRCQIDRETDEDRELDEDCERQMKLTRKIQVGVTFNSD
jgi:hypothetical protein